MGEQRLPDGGVPRDWFMYWTKWVRYYIEHKHFEEARLQTNHAAVWADTSERQAEVAHLRVLIEMEEAG